MNKKRFLKKMVGPKVWDRIRTFKRDLIVLKDALKGNFSCLKLYSAGFKLEKILTLEGKHVFFGYYDLQQLDDCEKQMLVHIIDVNSNPQKDPIEICVYDLEKDEYLRISKSYAWSWQQGARLRWNPLNNNQIIFNNCSEGKYVCEIWDLKQRCLLKKIPIPLYDIAPKMNYGFGLNFSRLQRLRPGYGYSALPDMTREENIPQDDGIFRYNFDSDTVQLLISYKRLCSDFVNNDDQHYINHISVSPDGDKFMFFHLWNSGNVNKWRLRLYVSDMDGVNLKLLEEDDVISHYTWRDNKTLMTTKINKNSDETCYYIYDVETGIKTAIKGENLYLDGHPSFFRDKDVFLSDTYPQSNNIQHLFMFNKQDNEYMSILDAYHDPRLYGEKRCDLHPRLSKTNKYISIDSTYKGNRRNVVLIKSV